MKVSNVFLLISRDVSVDSEDKMMSILKIIDRFNSEVTTKSEKSAKPEAVIIPLKFAIVSSWMFEEKIKKPQNIEIRMDIVDNDGKSMGGPTSLVEFPKDTLRFNLNFNVDGLKVTQSGGYVLNAKLLSPSKKVLATARYPFEVNLKWHHEKTEK